MREKSKLRDSPMPLKVNWIRFWEKKWKFAREDQIKISKFLLKIFFFFKTCSKLCRNDFAAILGGWGAERQPSWEAFRVWHLASHPPKMLQNRFFVVLSNFWKKKKLFSQNYFYSFGPPWKMRNKFGSKNFFHPNMLQNDFFAVLHTFGEKKNFLPKFFFL